MKDIVVEVAEQVKKEKGSDMKYHIGTMIETPRAALTAGRSLRKLSSSPSVQTT